MLFFQKRHLALILVFVLSTIILLTNLNGQDFSLDEPDTVAVARTIGEFGYPSAWDGRALIDVEGNFTQIGNRYVWTWHPWLQHYLAYFGLHVFGKAPGDIRLIFAFFGVMTVLMTYHIAHALFKSRLVALLVSVQLIFCLPFFLYIRQIRYYSPSAFFSVVTFYFFVKIDRQKNLSIKEKVGFLLSYILLFLSNYIIWVSSAVLIAGKLVLSRQWKLLGAVFAISICAGIWFFIFRPYSGNAGLFVVQPIEVYHRVITYLHYINNVVLPAIVVAIGLIATKRSELRIFLIWIGVKVFMYGTFQSAQGRYIVDIIPIVIILAGFVYQQLLKKQQLFLVTLIFLISAFTNVFSLALYPHEWKLRNVQFWPRAYFYELTGSYQSPMPQLGSYLKAQARPGDLFLSNEYRWYLYLYSDVPHASTLCKDNHLAGPAGTADISKVRWIIMFRYNTRLIQDVKNLCEGDKLTGFKKIPMTFSSRTVRINDPDIVNRAFPPIPLRSDDIEIYEKF